MFPLILIVILNTLMAFAHELSKPMKNYLTKISSEEQKIKDRIAVLTEELNEIQMVECYSDWVKKQRQLFALQRQLPPQQKTIAREIIKFGLGYVFQFIGSIMFIIISIYYRYTPIIVFDEKFNFAPFGKIIAFPTGVDNAISAPFWIFITNFTFRCVANVFRT